MTFKVNDTEGIKTTFILFLFSFMFSLEKLPFLVFVVLSENEPGTDLLDVLMNVPGCMKGRDEVEPYVGQVLLRAVLALALLSSGPCAVPTAVQAPA